MKKGKKSKTAAGGKIKGRGGDTEENPTMLEERFAAAETRPHFRTPTVESNKVVLDERFSSVLSDPRFQLDEKDKYGRDFSSSSSKNRNKNKTGKKGSKHKNNNNSSSKSSTDRRDEAANQLKDFYVVEKHKDEDEDEDDDDDSSDSESSSSSDDDDEANDDNDDQSKKKKIKQDDDDEGDGKVLDDPESRIAYLSALSRGELDVSSSSDEDDDDDSSGDDNDDHNDNDSDDDDDDSDDGGGEHPVYGTAGVLDPSTREKEEEDVELSFDPSPYLVVTNMDWENIRAVDLFVIMSSFAPPGSVKKVQVYQSDFGMEQMAKDRLHGPSDIWKKNKSKRGEQSGMEVNGGDENIDEDDDESSKSSSEGSDDHSDAGSDDDDDDDIDQDEIGLRIEEDDAILESDFDPEKLRSYEASKLKYYFAVVEFTEADHADIAYREVDGMEFEHSSAAVDLRTIPTDALQGVTADRPLRDQAVSVPGNYEPPDFVVSALQQTNVQCTWDQGDNERERKLTAYSNWNNMDEMDDLKAYLASDASSDEEEDSDEEGPGKGKGSRMRKLLGLDDDDVDDSDNNDDDSNKPSADRGQSFGSDDEKDDDDDDDERMSKTFKFIPGQKSLEEKIRSKLDQKDEKPTELTPWQKYQEKRKQKRRERRQASRGNKRGDLDNDSSPVDHDSNRKKLDKEYQRNSFDHDDESIEDRRSKEKRSKEQLELLLAGDHNEELARDFNIRGIQRLEKNKDKKFTGSRKRKEAKATSDIAGTDFKLNVEDDRFKAVLDGSDDRFGIDKTDPNYKDTSAMREILSEQTRRRKKKRQKVSNDVPLKDNKPVPVDVSVDDTAKKSSGASALSSLVKRMKQRM